MTVIHHFNLVQTACHCSALSPAGGLGLGPDHKPSRFCDGALHQPAARLLHFDMENVTVNVYRVRKVLASDWEGLKACYKVRSIIRFLLFQHLEERRCTPSLQ